MNETYIQCPKCGNPRCSLQYDDNTKEFYVWCIAPRCNISGPRARTPQEAIDRFYDETPKVQIDNCPFCGEKASITIGWRNGHSDYIFSHKKPSEECPYNRVVHFFYAQEVKQFLRGREGCAAR